MSTRRPRRRRGRRPTTSRQGKHSSLLAKAEGEGGLESWTLIFSAMKQEREGESE